MPRAIRTPQTEHLQVRPSCWLHSTRTPKGWVPQTGSTFQKNPWACPLQGDEAVVG